MDFAKFFPLKVIQKKYVESGKNFGDVVSYLYLGECIGFEGLLNTWEKWEGHYASRGFRTISLDRFVDYGGYGRPLDDVLHVKRDLSEDPVFHAKIYRANFLGKIAPAIDIQRLWKDGKTQSGIQIIPSTEDER